MATCTGSLVGCVVSAAVGSPVVLCGAELGLGLVLEGGPVSGDVVGTGIVVELSVGSVGGGVRADAASGDVDVDVDVDRDGDGVNERSWGA